MKFLIVSDSHGDYNLLSNLVYKHQDIDVFIHCGDYEIPEYLLNSFIYVRGNCDFLSDAPRFRELVYDDLSLYVEHGNHINFYDFENYVLSKEVNIFLFGHTHQKYEKKLGNTYVFNPGSLTRPRDSEKGSYLIIETSKDKIEYKFYDVDL